MRTLLLRLFCHLLCRLRWAYFHVHPGYIKFYMSPTEAHFFHVKTNTVHSNLRLRAPSKPPKP